ncbi:UbiX family flavin prenyltransferase [Yokenella regensburgei]|uniref:UbiX family flavin prenyltransferase n=1 Tax=Yokenella regensburgei TaxID=158877 RepID=UPI001432A309|nr:UbiX family flavin prenyltransferase [Yokenella regensburgei]QIU88502.1 UbiX family flavin prenyltransferase [Yokenella regensburgei]
MKKIIVAITGATGAPLALKLIEQLNFFDVEIHLVVSTWGETNLLQECGVNYQQLCDKVDAVYPIDDMGARISSGSFITDGMIIVPCSMKTLAAIRNGYTDNLISRTADVMLKENRPLVLVPRETPLSTIHLDNLLYLSTLGVVILPPMPAFYNNPLTIDDILSHLAARILDQIGLHHPSAKRWQGLNE